MKVDTTNILGHIYKKNLIPAYKIFKKMEENLVKKKNGKKIKRIHPLDLFKGFEWEDIKIKFVNGISVIIYADDIRHKADYIEMGFEDRRTFRPNKQWDFLRLMAIKRGILHWGDKEADPKIKKIKQLTSDTLKEYFQIQEDPFHRYGLNKEYRIKIYLIPEE
jgi:hypothetical protein